MSALKSDTRVIQAGDVDAALPRAGVVRERLVDLGLMFARRTDPEGRFYFVSNRSGRAVDGWIPLNIAAPAAVLFDPMSGRKGSARVRRSNAGSLEVYLDLPVDGSMIIASAARATRDEYPVFRPAGPAVAIGGPWTVRFVKGGPDIPALRTIASLTSWTAFEGDPHGRNFSGTAIYSTAFAAPSGKSDAWQLDLGRVHESARVRLNGRDLGVLIGPTFRLVLDRGSIRENNVLEVSVTNLSANRIADLDRRGVVWKKFYNVNMPARLPENRGADGLFTAAKWQPLDSGLVGPATLMPLARIQP
jgi:hypothetical protein